jgi:hypothetical protein
MLVAWINEIMEDIIVPKMSGDGTKPLEIQCHQATCYWLYQEAFGHPPTGDAYINGSFSSSGPFISEIAKLGRKLSKNDFTKRSVPGGTVLIFASAGLVAEHSCVMRWDGSIGGYNQQGWFGTQDKPSSWIVHQPSEIPWRGNKLDKVALANRQPPIGDLIGVNGDTAVKYTRDNFKANT